MKQESKAGHIIPAIEYYPKNRQNGDIDLPMNTIYHL